MTDQNYSFPHRVLWIGLLAAFLLPTRGGGDYKLAYLEGLRAVDADRWHDAVILFSQGIEDEPRSGGLVRPYGTWFEAYVPHFYLGLALYELERYAAALEAWKEAEAQVVIKYPRSKNKYRQMRERRETLPARLLEKLSDLREELDSLNRSRRRLEEVSSLRFRDGSGVLDTRASSIVAELLRKAAEQAGAGEIEAAAQTARAAEESLEQIWASTAARIENSDRLARAEATRGLVAIRRRADDDRRNRLEQAAVEIRRGGCSEEAVGVLDTLVLESMQAPEAEELAPRAYALLAVAHELCSRPNAAAIYRDLSLEDSSGTSRGFTGKPGPPSVGAAPAGRFAAFDAYLTALAWIELGACSDQPFSLLETARAALGEPGSDTALGRVAFQPNLAEAQAHRNCWNLTAARSSLEKAVELERPSGDLVDRLESWMEDTPFGALYSGSYALVVAGSDYGADTGWTDLPGAREDAGAVKLALERHGFQVEVLTDTLTVELERALRSFLARFGRKPGNRLVFYYAGHGWTEEAHDIKNGYIVPVDTPHPELHGDSAFLHLISMDVFEGYARSMLARHVLFVFDSCFGGTIFEATRARVESAAGTERLRDLLDRNVRMFLTAGDETQKVPDFSIFRRSIVKGLGGAADQNQDGVVLGHELGGYVRQRVSEESHTTPLWGRMMAGSLGQGDIAFYGAGAARAGSEPGSPDASALAQLRFDLEVWSLVRARDSMDRYHGYLELRPEGHFAELARWGVEDAGDEG